MKKYRFLIVVLTLFWAKSVFAREPGPCDPVVKVEAEEEDRWEATLNFKVTKQLNGVRIAVQLDSKADVLLSNFGDVSSTDNRNFLIKRPDLTVYPGDTITAKVLIKFGFVKTKPNISKVFLNDNDVCSNIPDIDVRTTQGKTGEICGIVPEAQSLIFNGDLSSEGAWPWHVALMRISFAKFDYTCGGSIISENFVLTAAHCVTYPKTKTVLGTQHFLLYIGVTKLSNIDIPSVNISTIGQIFIRDDYNPETYFNDIALLKLSNSLQFNKFIRPVCLWSESLDESSIIGRKGTIVGWGIDQRNKTYSTDLRHAEIPVVSLRTCREQSDFHQAHTNEKTFCAGGEEDKAVCSGDSGGGMIFRKPGTIGINSVWQIRGIVSVNKRQSFNDVCSTKSYAIFADVAKHLDWIKRTAGIA